MVSPGGVGQSRRMIPTLPRRARQITISPVTLNRLYIGVTLSGYPSQEKGTSENRGFWEIQTKGIALARTGATGARTLPSHATFGVGKTPLKKLADRGRLFNQATCNFLQAHTAYLGFLD